MASVVSITGCGLVVGGICNFGADPVGAIACIVIGIPLLIWARTISHNKAFMVWWKQVVDANLVPEIAKSTQTAVDIYNKNPQERTLKKISELNPTAAAQIRAAIAAQNKK